MEQPDDLAQNAREQNQERRQIRRFARGCLIASLAIFLAIVACVVVLVSTGNGSPSEAEQVRCRPVPQSLVAKINSGLTAQGNAYLSSAKVVKNNDGRSWSFIAGKIEAPGLNGSKAVWATGSLDLNQDSLLVAADQTAAEFSIWNLAGPSGEGFGSQFDDDIDLARRCLD